MLVPCKNSSCILRPCATGRNVPGAVAGHLLPRPNFQLVRQVTSRCAPSSSNNVSNEPLLQSVNESLDGTSQGTMSTRVGTTSVSAQSLITWDTDWFHYTKTHWPWYEPRTIILGGVSFIVGCNLGTGEIGLKMTIISAAPVAVAWFILLYMVPRQFTDFAKQYVQTHPKECEEQARKCCEEQKQKQEQQQQQQH